MADADGQLTEQVLAAEQDERRRIALFLHDGPVQNLAGIALMLDAALHAASTGKIDDATSACSAGAKPWSLRITGSSAKERSRSSRIVSRCRSSAIAMIARASSVLPSAIECCAASSIRAIPASCCTGPSWRNSAMRRRSSCSAAISRSRPSDSLTRTTS